MNYPNTVLIRVDEFSVLDKICPDAWGEADSPLRTDQKLGEKLARLVAVIPPFRTPADGVCIPVVFFRSPAVAEALHTCVKKNKTRPVNVIYLNYLDAPQKAATVVNYSFQKNPTCLPVVLSVLDQTSEIMDVLSTSLGTRNKILWDGNSFSPLEQGTHKLASYLQAKMSPPLNVPVVA